MANIEILSGTGENVRYTPGRWDITEVACAEDPKIKDRFNDVSYTMKT